MILFIVSKEYWKAFKNLEKKYLQCLGDMLSLMGVTESYLNIGLNVDF